YLMKDVEGHILYVGKAASLRHRVRSYFSPPLSPKLSRLMARVADVDYILTASEQEALILECNLIKEHRPHYNVRLKDDKSYPYIKITLSEPFPRVLITRRFEPNGDRYFGPFASASSVRHTLDLVKKLFRYCSLKRPITGKERRPCFDYYIRRCVGACVGKITRDDYRHLIQQVILFLEGKQEAVLRDLKKGMGQAATRLEYEKAAALRDQIQAVESIMERQRAVSTRREDADVIAFVRERDIACVQVFFVRSGKLIGREHFVLEGTQGEEPGRIIASFLQQYYGSASKVPPLVLLPEPPDDEAMLRGWLETRRGSRVRLQVPRRGARRELVEMAQENAHHVLEQLKVQWLIDSGKASAALAGLKEALGLPQLPHRMECYDISDIQGTSAVGSMVVFEEGKPKPSDYRRFRIKTVAGNDDYAMMAEVLRRRFKKVLQPKDEATPLRQAPSTSSGQRQGTAEPSPWGKTPDLVLIDGGKGHLAIALDVMQEAGLSYIPTASIAKENEDIFLPGRAEPLALPPNSQALYLLQRLRDEAHRFALSYHLKVRKKKTMASALDDITGIGPKRKRTLLQRFGSLKGIKEALLEELAALPGMTAKLAQRVKEGL
ncbi:MAG: excinuclease ABC subunit UvrC, partial [Chloroflexota bacterium]|nr:excinuclease ABC subunit UvrC [Chloroflexota bacterium]